jgi:hypothetical protein
MSVSETKVNPTRGRQRRRYVINASFQWKYTITVTVLVFCLSSLMTVLLYGVLYGQARTRSLLGSDPAEVTGVVVGWGLAFSTIVAIGVGMWCLMVTRQICGPLSVMGEYLLEVTRGRFPTLRPLRRHDEFREFYAVFSSAINAMRARQRAEFDALSETLRTAEMVAFQEGTSRRVALESLVSQLKALRHEAADGLGVDLGETDEHKVDVRESAPPAPAVS